jgi:hypothetical protein
MGRTHFGEIAFLQVKVILLLGILVMNAEAEEYSKVKGKEDGEISGDGVSFRFFETFVQQLDHINGYRIPENIGENILVEKGPFIFPDPLQVLKLVVIHFHFQDGCRLKIRSLGRAFFGNGANAVHQV